MQVISSYRLIYYFYAGNEGLVVLPTTTLLKPSSSVADNCLKFTIIIDSEKRNQVYSCRSSGLRLFLPNGPLPDAFNGKAIEIRTSTRDSFHFPADANLASAIYTIVSDVAIDVALEMEHCYRGDLQALAFGCCSKQGPPFTFEVASKESYKYSFTSTHGVIQTKHFSNWVILWFKSSWQKLTSIFSQPSFPEEFVIFPYYQIQSTYIRVNLVILKRLKAHIEVNIIVQLRTIMYITKSTHFVPTYFNIELLSVSDCRAN